MVSLNFIHPPDFKNITRNKKIEIIPIPKKVILPLSQHAGAPSEPVVNAGDSVKTGSLIAQAKGFISSNLHSSISGKVIAIEESSHPVIGSSRAIIIESDGQDIKTYLDSVPAKDILGLSKEEIMTLIKEAGIVGLGGAAFPLSVKLSPPPAKKINSLIINGAECEPFLTCDHRLMLEKPKEIILGAQLIAKVLGVKDITIGIEENKLNAIESLNSASFRLKAEELKVKVVRLKTRYPQGGEKQLIKTLLNKEVPSGGLPLDIGIVVNNAQTVFAVYEAVYLRKPLYERVITISGSFSNIAKNILVRIGTPIKDVLDYCGLSPKLDIYKIVMGGPMTGVAQCNLNAPIIKGTSGILVMDKRCKLEGEELECIRCSRCIEACPAGLMPCMIGLSAKKEKFDIASSYDPFDCIECGSCSFVCPSNIPLVQLIKLAKLKIKRQ
ncbi:MAG TPA: electron transport complex subunit RsxC [Candidatus Omnitrophica bacterium]|nr:electron transport complex subunit RsxC [Candidatus Omnitrophota bacterium]